MQQKDTKHTSDDEKDLESNIKARHLEAKSIWSPEKLKEHAPTKQQENSDIENFRERLWNVEHNEKMNNFLLSVLVMSITASIVGLAWSYWITIPTYQIEYNKQVAEFKTEYNWKINEQQNTIKLQQAKIQNLEDDVNDLEDIVKKYFIK